MWRLLSAAPGVHSGVGFFGGLDVVSEEIYRGAWDVLKPKGKFLLMSLSGGSVPEVQRVCPCVFSMCIHARSC